MDNTVLQSFEVIKRDGTKEPFRYECIQDRIEKLADGSALGLHKLAINAPYLVQKVTAGLPPVVHTSFIDQHIADICALQIIHPDYIEFASRILVSDLHRNITPQYPGFLDVVRTLNSYVHPVTKKHTELLSNEILLLAQEFRHAIEEAIDYKRDYEISYFGLRTLMRNYLMTMEIGTAREKKILERPQDMFMRVALGIHGRNIADALETYQQMSTKHFIHATPTLVNAGTPRPQLASCFLATMDDSLLGIYDLLGKLAQISKYAGGIGVSLSDVRATGSYISGTNGESNGLIYLLRLLNASSRYVDQGGNKRPGSMAIYLEPWHADIYHFLDAKKHQGMDEQRARDLFYGLWIPDLFMRRCESNGSWTLMCPHECPGLTDVWGEKFDALYEQYEREGRGRKTLPAMELMRYIIHCITLHSMPYILFKDHANRKSNQQNLGTIKCSNLCTEIIEYTSRDEIAVCNLASVVLPTFVRSGSFDFAALEDTVKIITKNLNRVITNSFYPVEEARTSNLRHRPIGIGVQGLADVFLLLDLPFTSEPAQQLNRDIFETIYYAALCASCELAEREGVYSSYEGSPISQGILQFDMWTDVSTSKIPKESWETLRGRIKKYGVRNSLLIAPMPTASTAQIMGCNECFEPYTANTYTRRVSAGEYIIINPHLIRKLQSLNLWRPDIIQQIIRNQGSVQNISEFPENLKSLFLTVWEMKIGPLLKMAAARAPFIDQSFSNNIFCAEPTANVVWTYILQSWKYGLKTAQYYLRTLPATTPVNFITSSSAGTSSSVCSRTPDCLACQ